MKPHVLLSKEPIESFRYLHVLYTAITYGKFKEQIVEEQRRIINTHEKKELKFEVFLSIQKYEYI